MDTPSTAEFMARDFETFAERLREHEPDILEINHQSRRGADDVETIEIKIRW